MVKFLFYNFIAMLAIAISSCSKENEEVFLSVDNDNILLKQTEATTSLSISCNSSWQVTKTGDWLAISEMSGEGNKIVKISAGDNDAFSTRKCNLTITSGNIKQDISIGQEGKEYIVMQSLKITNKDLDLEKGSSINFTYDVIPSNSTGKDSIQWISDNQDIATIDDNGLLKAQQAGECNVTIKYKNGDIKDTRKVVVLPEPLTGIEFMSKNLNLCYGSYGLFGVKAIPSSAKLPNLTYTSSVPNVLSIDNSGSYKISNGNIDIQVSVTTATVDNKFSDVLQITISDIFVNVTGLNFNLNDYRKVSFKADIQSLGNASIQGFTLYDHNGLFRSFFKPDPFVSERYISEIISIDDMAENGDQLFDKLSTWTCDISYFVGSDPIMRMKRVKVNAHLWG